MQSACNLTDVEGVRLLDADPACVSRSWRRVGGDIFEANGLLKHQNKLVRTGPTEFPLAEIVNQSLDITSANVHIPADEGYIAGQAMFGCSTRILRRFKQRWADASAPGIQAPAFGSARWIRPKCAKLFGILSMKNGRPSLR